ncbi:MAG: hypothetical protein GKR89_16180 [Candidatus Latescibacteria bacterium]|nr:hypothetical protein [Candidatus Latescibacterota bacterium]
MRAIYTLLGFWYIMALSGCGVDVAKPQEQPNLEALAVDLNRDIGANLQRHFSAPAAKEPMRAGQPAVQFDFLEESRTLDPEGEAVINGPFLFTAKNGDKRQGRIAVYYRYFNDGWVPTGRFGVEEGPVDSHTLVAVVRNGVTDAPLQEAAVVARRRVGDSQSAQLVRTNAEGVAQIEVLQGEFEVSAEYSGYRSSTAHVEVVEKRQVVGDMRLMPVGDGVRQI